MTKDEMVGWCHQFSGHEFEQALGDGERQGSLAYCSPCPDTTERLTATNEELWGFLGSSSGRESTCNEENSCLIPGLGSSHGEGIAYSLQYSWASLVAQMVKNPPAMQETWVRSLAWEDPLEEGMATHSSILA